MLRRILILFLSAVLIAGCAAYPDTRKQRMESLPQHYAQFDLVMGWDTKVTDSKTIIEGVVKNVRYAYMYDLEIRVAVLNAAGKTGEHGVAFVIPRQLEMDQMADFSVKLPVAVEPGTKLRFIYRYRGSDAGDSDGGMDKGVDWMQSFDAVVPAR
jgi:PBP1b-binding outer membrane lipoprotein LpoB